MKSIEKWLKENGLKYENITLTGGKPALMVDTNYIGLYPKKETFEKIDQIEKKIKRFKKLTCNACGFYTGVLIKEA